VSDRIFKAHAFDCCCVVGFNAQHCYKIIRRTSPRKVADNHILKGLKGAKGADLRQHDIGDGLHVTPNTSTPTLLTAFSTLLVRN
jgi:hypothetical protein